MREPKPAAFHRSFETTTDFLWYLTDHQNSVTDVVESESSGATNRNHIEYDSFGNIITVDDPSTATADDGDLPGETDTYSPVRCYTGREPDALTGLIYYRACWFDPNTGTFVSEDPIGFPAGDTNLTRYVGNGTPNATDPSRLYEDDDVPPVLAVIQAIEEMKAEHEDNRRVKNYLRGRGQRLSNVTLSDGSIRGISHQIDARVLQQIQKNALLSQRQVRPYSTPGNDDMIPIRIGVSAVPYHATDNTDALEELEAEEQMLENSRQIMRSGIPVVGTYDSFKGLVDPTKPWYSRTIDGAGLAGDVIPGLRLLRIGDECADVTRIGGKVNTSGGLVAPNDGAKLLPGEGNVGTYRDLIKAGTKGDNITPHHIPSANHMKGHGVSKGDGISINMEHPHPGSGGRHRETFTYGTRADNALSPRDALGRGVRDTKRIYEEHGLYSPEIRKSLQDLIRQNRAANPGLFD